MKRFRLLIIFILMLTLMSSMPVYAKNSKQPKHTKAPKNITVVVNDKTIKSNPKPYLKDGEVMVPLRPIAEAIGAKVTWDKYTKTAWVEYNTMRVEIPVGKKSFFIHHNADFSGFPLQIFFKRWAQFVDNKVVVPAKTFLESLGLTVNYDSKTKILSIKSPSTLPSKVPYEEIPSDYVKGNAALRNWYNTNNMKAGISYIRDGGYIYALIGGGEKPTGGYSVLINSVTYITADTISISAKVTPPGDNVRVMMVITYPSKLIRIKSDTIKTVVGTIEDQSNTLSKLTGVTMNDTTLLKAELLSLDQVKLRDLTVTEKANIMKSFNEATIDPNMYVQMIAGNVLKVTTKDGAIITFTSYGSKTNCVATITIGNTSSTYHIVAPAIAELLLEQSNSLSKTTGVIMNDTTLSKAELLSIDQVKLRDLTITEKSNVMKSFNEATIDSNMYIQMITGNVLRILMKDGTIATFTSYGSKTNCVVTLTKGNTSSTYHIVAPTIAELLLEQSNSLSKTTGVAMNDTTLSKAELLSIDQVKLRDLTITEKSNVMKSFNEATIDPNMYIQMITGNVLRILMKDGTIVTFTSYGSKTNCVVTLTKGNTSSTYHIVAPVIAELLLEQSNILSKVTGLTMNDTTLLKLELFSIEQVKLRDLSNTEKRVIMKAFNEATIDPNMYIEMITGDVLKATMKDGSVLSFTSYGSKTNCVVTITKGNTVSTFHVIAPDIAQILLNI